MENKARPVSPFPKLVPTKLITRYVLNYKQLPYTTVALEYTELESKFKKLGVPPSSTKPDGSPLYTSPSILDGELGVSDSYKIAEYLDKAYPTTPKVIPPGSEALQAAFYDQFGQLLGPLWPLYLPRVAATILNPPSEEYFTVTRTKVFGKQLKDVEPTEGKEREEAWKQFQANLDVVEGWMSKSPGPFFMGATPTFADFTVASFILALRICFGKESKEWKNIETWNGGRWKDLVKNLEKYENAN